jgi:hypothetical protein
MQRHMILALIFWPALAMAEDWRRLDGPAITAALSARSLVYGDGTSQNFFADGRTLYEAGAGASWGKWWAEADRYCSTWPPNSTPSCYGVASMGLDIRFTAISGAETIGRYNDLN